MTTPCANGTLTDNFFCKLSKSTIYTIPGILINTFSDHQPYFICLNTISYEAPPPKYIRVTYEAISNILHDSIERAKYAHLPDKIVKLKKHKHMKNSWITSGILRSIKHRDGMYKKLKSEKPNSHQYITIETNLKTYNTILKRSIRLAKIKLPFPLC